MERNQSADVLSESCFSVLESTKFNGPVEKCQPAKLSEKISQKGSSANTTNFKDSTFLEDKNHDNSISNSVVSLNSSPHYNTNSYQQYEGKRAPAKISDQVTGHELLRNSGVGRGKHRSKYAATYDADKGYSCSPDGDKMNSPEMLEVESGPACNIEVHKIVKAVSGNTDSTEKCDGLVESDPREHLFQRNNSHLKDAEVKNVPNSNDRYRENDYRRIPNGLDPLKPFTKGKPFRLQHFQNTPMQYKYDGRPAQKYFPLSQTLNALRTVKCNDYYRHNDIRRNQSSKMPCSPDMDKMAYGKPRLTMCSEKDIMMFDSNRNLSHSSNKSDTNYHFSSAEPFVSRPGLSMFRRRSFGSKNDHVNNPKHWSANRLYSDSGTATVNCHGRTVVTPAKSADLQHCGTCNVDKNGNNNSITLKPDSCDSGASENSECLSLSNKEVFRLKTNCSPGGGKSTGVFPGNSTCLNSTAPVHLDTSLHAQYPALGDDKCAEHSDATHQQPFESDVPEKSVVSGLSSCDFHGEKYSSHENFSKQAAHIEAGLSPTNYNGSNRCSPLSMNSTQASYADIIRTPTTSHKVSSVFHSSGPPVNRTAEVAPAAMQDIFQKEEQVSSSSEWIISRLSQVHARTNLNGGSLHQVGSNHDGVIPRPIAVSLEKPSFYNSSLGIAKTLNSCVPPSSLSSPEKRIFECQFVEEHLCSMLSNKKTGDKISFLSELPASLSSGEQSSSMACTSSRTDSVFSDSSSVCSSTSSTFKIEMQRQVADLKNNMPPVIIMNNCMPMSNVSDISFGIEMDEIMQICSDSSKDSSYAGTPQLSDYVNPKNSGLLHSENEGPNCAAMEVTNGLDLVTIGGKNFLWKDDVDASKCNLGHIMDFLQQSWHHIELAVKNAGTDESTDVVKYYSDE